MNAEQGGGPGIVRRRLGDNDDVQLRNKDGRRDVGRGQRNPSLSGGTRGQHDSGERRADVADHRSRPHAATRLDHIRPEEFRRRRLIDSEFNRFSDLARRYRDDRRLTTEDRPAACEHRDDEKDRQAVRAPVQTNVLARPDRVRKLSASAGDGRFARSATFGGLPNRLMMGIRGDRVRRLP